MLEETFSDLLNPHLPAIRKLVRAKMRAQDYVDDVVQQTLLQAFTHRDQLQARAKFKSWICSIAMNEIRGLARRSRFSLPLDTPPALAAPDESACPHKAYEKRERAGRLRAGLERLNARDRRAIHLMDFAELNIGEAARSMSVSPAAMKSTHYRARLRLSRALRTKMDPA